MNRSTLTLVPIALTLILSAACGAATESSTPTPPASEAPSATRTSSSEPTPTPTSVPIPPSIQELVINGIELQPQDYIYQIPGEVNPGDKWELTIVIEDDNQGSVEVLGHTKSYSPSADHQTHLQISLTIPPDLTANEFPIQLKSGEDTGEYFLSFTPGTDWPPIIVLNAPSEVVTGEKVTLDASGSFDFSGDPITFSWSQVHNLDRYTGSEYVTGNEVVLETSNQSITVFTPDWPGKYRFKVVASDEDGESSITVDMIAYPQSQLFPIRGMAIAGTSSPWSEDLAYEMLEHLASLGFNYIQVGVSDSMDSPTSNEILIDQNPLDWVLTLEQYLSIINMAHELGLGVMLSPMIGFMHEDTWYEAYNITPSDPTAWLKSYQEFAVFYSRLAEEHDVEILNLGGGTYQFHGNSQGWKEVLEDIRSVYSGTVAYSWFKYPCCDIPFPHIDELDMLVTTFNWNGSGISFTGNRVGKNHPTVSEMTKWFDLELSRYVDVLQSRYQKPIMSTDLYPFPVDGMNIHPVALYWTDVRPVDNQEPIDYTEAAFRVASERGWDGFFFWEVKLGPPNDWLPDIRDKPIEEMIRIWFSPKDP